MNKGAEKARHEAKNAPWLTTAHVICTDEGVAHGSISERLEALRDKLADKAQQTTEETDAEMALRSIASWLGVGGFNAPTFDAKVFEQRIYEGVEMAIKSHYVAAEEPELPEAAVNVAPYDPNHVYWNAGHPNDGVNSPLFTTAQMHDHFHAGVRAGMAQQSQDAKLEPLVREALRKAFSFGQRYWQQADSEYASDHKKSDETQRKFLALIEETIAAMQGGQK